MLLLLLTSTITTRTSQFHKFFWLLFVLICFPIQNSLCLENGPGLNDDESTTLLPNQALQNQSEAVDVNVSEVPVSNNVTESSIVTNNTSEVETTTGNDDSTETETPTPGASEVTESNISSTNSSSDLLPPTSNSINSTLDALQNNTNNATEAPSDQISQSSDGTEVLNAEPKVLLPLPPQNTTLQVQPTAPPAPTLTGNTSTINPITTNTSATTEKIQTIFDEMNRNDTNIEHNAVTAVGDGSDDIIDVEQDTIEDTVVGQKKNQNVQKNATLAEDTVNDIDELRRQMIIITSILGGVVVLTLMLVLALAVSISKMKAKFSNKHERYLASTPDTGAAISPSIRQNRQQEIHAYDNSAFNSGGSSGHEMEERRVDSKSEVERLGYEMYNGKHENR